MARYSTLIRPNYGTSVQAGNCLVMAQNITGAKNYNYEPGDSMRATYAANMTKYRHATRTMPDAVCVLWFYHQGNYSEGPGEYGHVVVYDPARPAGSRYASSRRWGTGTPEFFGTIEDIEREFNSTFRFWSEDINQKRVCEPVQEDDDMPIIIVRDSTGKRAFRRYNPVTQRFEGANIGKADNEVLRSASDSSRGAAVAYATISDAHFSEIQGRK